MKVSIIIPVFNVEKYILRCLASVNAQTYRDIEVILIDDCGNDKSITIAKQFINENKLSDKFTIISHAQNMGLSVARNTGIRNSTGNYLFFLDSDDEISPKCIELLANGVSQTCADFCIGRIAYITSSETIENKHSFNKPTQQFNQNETISLYLADKLPWNAVNRLIRRDFIISNNLYFTENITSEDLLWNFQSLQYIKCIVAINDITYYYYSNPGSIMSSASTNKKYAHDLIAIGELMNLIISTKKEHSLLVKYYIHLRYSFITFALLWHKYPNKVVQLNFSNRFVHYVHLPISRKIIFLFPSKIIPILERCRFNVLEYLQLIKTKIKNAHA